jgi:hypothetical protein
MNDADLHLLIHGGRTTPLLVARLEREFVELLDSNTDAVWLFPNVAQKLRFKHKLTFGHFLQIPLALKYGRVSQDRDGTLFFLYYDEVIYGCSFIVSVKVTGQRHELILSTAHKIRAAEATRKCRKFPAIRDFWES